MGKISKREALEITVKRMKRRQAAVDLLIDMERRGLARYDYESRRFTFVDEIHDSIAVQVIGNVFRMIFPTYMRALADCDWEGGVVDSNEIVHSAMCYVTDDYFSVVFSSTKEIDELSEDCTRVEFCTYEESGNSLTNIEVLQYRGEEVNADSISMLPRYPKSEVMTCSGRPFVSPDAVDYSAIPEVAENVEILKQRSDEAGAGEKGVMRQRCCTA
ncbi:MAG: hypothetical protein R6X15_07125 [Pseudomonadota bacterium]